MSLDAEVAVVGLGAMGAATLYQLAKRGVATLGIDRHAPPHAHGSTHGESRITREAVGEGADYVPLARRSHAIWRELEAATGATLLTRCGGLVIGRPDGGPLHGAASFVGATIAVARASGIAHKLLDRAALARRYPQFIGVGEDEIGYFEPGAGFVRPEACVAAQLAEARRHGADVRTGVAVFALREEAGAVVIETDSGTIRAARAVVAAGAWTGALLGAPWDALLTISRQRLIWFAPKSPTLYDTGCPVYIRVHGAGEQDSFYGFPRVDGAIDVKLATEDYANLADPATYAPGPAEEDAAYRFFATHVAGRLAGLSPRATRTATCLYTSTRDGRFLIGAHPSLPKLTVISACSGHGFKHSAAIGELVAARTMAELRLTPFALG